MERTGWSGMTKHFGKPDHPVCGDKAGYAAFFLMPQPPLLYQEGSCRPPILFRQHALKPATTSSSNYLQPGIRNAPIFDE